MGSELLFILLVALVILGPDQLPGLARNIGHFVGRARRTMRNLSAQVEQELSAEEIRKAVAAASTPIDSAKPGAKS